MAHSCRVVAPNLVVSQIYNPFQIHDIVGMLQAILDERAPLRGVKVFCEVSDVTPDGLSFRDMKAVIDFVRLRINDFAGMKYAACARGLLNYGFIRMAGELGNGLPYEYRAFRDPEMALNWLCVPPALRSEIQQAAVA